AEIPSTADACLLVTKLLLCTTRVVNLLYFAVSKKSYEAAVRRPERKRCPFRPGERLRRGRPERPQPERLHPISADGHDREPQPIGRHRHVIEVQQVRVLRWRDHRADGGQV